MPTCYSKKEIEQIVDNAILKSAENPKELAFANLYKSDFFNYTGQAKEENRCYTEVIIEYLKDREIIKHGLIADIQMQTRTARNPINTETIYYTSTHKQLLEDFDENKITNRAEENLIKKICKDRTENKQNYENIIGTAIDFQVPLKSKQNDSYGKIDLLTYKKDTKTLYIVEAKRQDSTETLLRACMEIQTYYQILDAKTLIEDFKKSFPDIIDEVGNVKKAVLIFKGSTPSNEYADLENRPNLKQLIKDFDIEIWDLEG